MPAVKGAETHKSSLRTMNRNVATASPRNPTAKTGIVLNFIRFLSSVTESMSTHRDETSCLEKYVRDVDMHNCMRQLTV